MLSRSTSYAQMANLKDWLGLLEQAITPELKSQKLYIGMDPTGSYHLTEDRKMKITLEQLLIKTKELLNASKKETTTFSPDCLKRLQARIHVHFYEHTTIGKIFRVIEKILPFVSFVNYTRAHKKWEEIDLLLGAKRHREGNPSTISETGRKELEWYVRKIAKNWTINFSQTSDSQLLSKITYYWNSLLFYHKDFFPLTKALDSFSQKEVKVSVFQELEQIPINLLPYFLSFLEEKAKEVFHSLMDISKLLEVRIDILPQKVRYSIGQAYNQVCSEILKKENQFRLVLPTIPFSASFQAILDSQENLEIQISFQKMTNATLQHHLKNFLDKKYRIVSIQCQNLTIDQIKILVKELKKQEQQTDYPSLGFQNCEKNIVIAALKTMIEEECTLTLLQAHLSKKDFMFFEKGDSKKAYALIKNKKEAELKQYLQNLKITEKKPDFFKEWENIPEDYEKTFKNFLKESLASKWKLEDFFSFSFKKYQIQDEKFKKRFTEIYSELLKNHLNNHKQKKDLLLVYFSEPKAVTSFFLDQAAKIYKEKEKNGFEKMVAVVKNDPKIKCFFNKHFSNISTIMKKIIFTGFDPVLWESTSEQLSPLPNLEIQIEEKNTLSSQNPLFKKTQQITT